MTCCIPAPDLDNIVFSRFTASSRQVMKRAFREAKHWQHDFVGSEHLLYGLLCDAEGPASTMLRSLHVMPALMLEKVELSLRRHDAEIEMEQFPLSPASKRVFRFAAEEAAQLNHQLIGPEHLLLGILREGDCEAAQILTANGVTLSGARAALAQIPPDTFREAQIQPSVQPNFAHADNPTAQELESWTAPAITVEKTTANADPGATASSLELQLLALRLRQTQVALGGVTGFLLGFSLIGLSSGLVCGLLGSLIGFVGKRWVSVLGFMLMPTLLFLFTRGFGLKIEYFIVVVPVCLLLAWFFLGNDWKLSGHEIESAQRGSDNQSTQHRNG